MTIPPRPLQQKKCASQGGPQVVTCRLIFFHFHFFIDFSFLYFFSFHFSAFLFLPPPHLPAARTSEKGKQWELRRRLPTLQESKQRRQSRAVPSNLTVQHTVAFLLRTPTGPWAEPPAWTTTAATFLVPAQQTWTLPGVGVPRPGRAGAVRAALYGVV